MELHGPKLYGNLSCHMQILRGFVFLNILGTYRQRLPYMNALKRKPFRLNIYRMHLTGVTSDCPTYQ